MSCILNVYFRFYNPEHMYFLFMFENSPFVLVGMLHTCAIKTAGPEKDYVVFPYAEG